MTHNGRLNGDSRQSCSMHHEFQNDCEFCVLSDKIDRTLYGDEE